MHVFAPYRPSDVTSTETVAAKVTVLYVAVQKPYKNCFL